MADKEMERFELEMEGVLGETDLGGNVSLNALSCLRNNYDIGVVNDHESLHRNLVFFSAFGFFEQLLHKLVCNVTDPADHRALYKSLLEKCIGSSILTHEGIAAYITWVSIIRNNPEKQQEYLRSLTGVYKTGFGYAVNLLPDPKHYDITAAAYTCLNNCAQLVGKLLCCCPILEHYKDWRRITDNSRKYLDFETIDETFIALSENAERFQREIIQYFEASLPRMEKFYENFNAFTDSGIKEILQHATEDERIFGEEVVTSLPEFGDYIFSYQKNKYSYQKLLENWQRETTRQGYHYLDSSAFYSIDTVREDLLVSRTLLPPSVETVCKRNIVNRHEACDCLIREMENESSLLAIFRLDGLFRRAKRGWLFNKQTNEFVQGKNGWDIQYGNDILLYLPEIINLANHDEHSREQELPYTQLKLNFDSVTHCIESLSRGNFRCFTNAEPYIVLQLIHYQHAVLDLGFIRMKAKNQDAYPKLFLPNVFLRAKNCLDLVSFFFTVQQDYRRSVDWTIIEGNNLPKVCLIKIADEIIYAFSDYGNGERFFIRDMTKMAGHQFRAKGAEKAINGMMLAEQFLSGSECNLDLVTRLQPRWVGGMN